jgi:hypothetical protein
VEKIRTTKRREGSTAKAQRGKIKKEISCEVVPQTYSRKKVFF